MAQEGCTDSPMAFRVGNGSFLSMEIELRNYLRGVYSLLMSLYPTQTSSHENARINASRVTEARNSLLNLSNGLIRQMGSINKSDFNPDRLTDHLYDLQDSLSDIRDLVTDRMDELDIAESDFRREMLDQLIIQSARLITEQGQLASEIRTMDFMDAAARPGDHSLYNRKSSAPWNRGSQRH